MNTKVLPQIKPKFHEGVRDIGEICIYILFAVQQYQQIPIRIRAVITSRT